MKGTKKEILKYIFTKYVKTALIRTRKDFMSKEKRKSSLEETLALEIMYDTTKEETNLALELVLEVTWEAKAIREYLKQQVGEIMERSLSGLTDLEITVVFAKVFRQLTFAEIGKIMEMDEKKIAYIYSYARTKLKKAVEKNGIS